MEQKWDNIVVWRNWDNMKRVIYKLGECKMQCDDENDQAKNNLSNKCRIFKMTHFIVWKNWDNMEQKVVWRKFYFINISFYLILLSNLHWQF